jgi:RNA polymerase sigma-70 factor (ECF subfamily)
VIENRDSPPALCFVRPTFEQLYSDVRRWLPNDLRRLGLDRLDAEDLLHDVVMIAHRQMDRFDPNAGRRHDDPVRALRAWIYGIAWRQVDKRHKQASLRDPVAQGTHEAPSVEEAAAAGDRRRILIAVLDKLKPRRAEVLVLYAVRGMTMPEIARHLGLKENTVKSRIIRGRADALRAIQRLPPEQRSALEGPPATLDRGDAPASLTVDATPWGAAELSAEVKRRLQRHVAERLQPSD